MASVSFTKLHLKVNTEKTVLHIGEVDVEVKQYLPLTEKIALVERIVNQSIDNNGFYNPMRVKTYLTVEVLYAYTNINFTDKMKEEPDRMYDTFVSSGVFNQVRDAMGFGEWQAIVEDVYETIKNIYDYRNSVFGILDNISTNYKNLDLEATGIQQKLQDPESLGLLKEVLTKLG